MAIAQIVDEGSFSNEHAIHLSKATDREFLNIKPDNQQLTVVALILYVLVMLSLILIYRDLLITITAVIIMAVLLVQYLVPLLKERKSH